MTGSGEELRAWDEAVRQAAEGSTDHERNHCPQHLAMCREYFAMGAEFGRAWNTRAAAKGETEGER